MTNALLGQGAGDSAYCFSNSVFGGTDAYSTDGHLAHALVVIIGVCAATASSLPDLKYHLVRSLGRVLGLDGRNSTTTSSPATQCRRLTITRDSAHAQFRSARMHAHLALPFRSRLAENGRPRCHLASVSRYAIQPYGVFGQRLLATTTGRIHGSVYFSDSAGNPTQPMTGVNVIARRIDTPGQPSGRYAASSVSGFGYAAIGGNIVNGYTNAAGQRFDRFGSNDVASEGYLIWPDSRSLPAQIRLNFT